MSHEPLVLGFGGVAADLLCEVNALPTSDGVTYIRSFKREAGGMVGTALAAVARLGGRCGYSGAIGRDDEGETIVESLEASGVDCSRVHRGDPGDTPFSIVLVEGNGRRSIVHHRGNRDRDTVSGPLPVLDGVDHLHIDCTWLASAITLAAAATERGIPVSIDVSQNQRDPRIGELLPYVTDAVVNAPFARRFTGRRRLPACAATLREMGARTVVITNGDGEGWCDSQSVGSFSFPAADVGPVVDTTGAGDAFHGAYVYARRDGLDEPEAVRFAAVAAALNCRSLGGQAGLPTRDEVEAFL